ncbi:MAG: hypothetical protein JW787_01560 [Sedimentisphaerales bacterium]|nr:hypothetical protein [Sedimentisphaerales bacterium]
MNYQNFFKSVVILTLVWILLISISGWSSVTSSRSSEDKIKPEQEISDITCNLLPEKQQWQVSEIPKFKAYIPKPRDINEYLTKLLGLLGINPENENLLMAVIEQQNCQIKVDKQWYRYINPEWTGGMGTYNDINWLVQAGAFISISLDPKHWVTLDNSSPLVLEPGKHTISFGWAGIIKSSNTNTNQKDKPVLLASKPIKIEILKSSEPSAKMSETEEHRRRVTELFNSYAHANSLTKEEQELGLKTDLRTFEEFHPKFMWEDIPFLLELAQNDNLHKGMPKLGISSYAGQYCREGMIALWFIEGLRREQVSLAREKQIGEKLHVGSYRLPLNAMCVKKGMSSRECEQSLEIHKSVLQAYINWWQTVGSLPAPQASVFYPLDLMDIEWGGSENDLLVLYKEQSSSGTIAEKAIRHSIYTGNKYQPDKTFQTIYYSLKNPDENPPYIPDKLKVQKIVLYYYDEQGKVIRTEEILPADK